MGDRPELQGVWRVQGVTLQGSAVHSQQTHLVVAGETWREVWDRVLYADEPRPETRFSVDGAFLELKTTWHLADGQAEGPFEGRWAFELEGDTLMVCVAGYDSVPTAVDDTEGTVTTYARVTDPETIARVITPPTFASRPTRHHPVLGELRWDANLSWFKTKDGVLSLAVPQDAPLDDPAARARALLEGASELALFAADELMETYNASWREEGPEVTRTAFAAHLVLEGITVFEDLSAEAYFEDGDLFWGHVVLVSVDPNGRPTDATIAG